MNGFTNKAIECRAAAEEIRIAANNMKDPVNRASLLRIAAGYERLADRLDAHHGAHAAHDGGGD